MTTTDTTLEDTQLARWLADADHGRGPDPVATLYRDELDTLLAAVESQREAQHRVDLAVANMRQHGASWAVVGEALGVSRQAAHERYRAVGTLGQ